MLEENLKGLVIRKTLPSLRNTCMSLIKDRAKAGNVDYKLNNQTQTATVGRNCTLIYLSCNDEKSVEKIKSITDVDFIWVEEATDLRDSDYKIIKGRLRGGVGSYNQIILSFNPVGKFSWIYKRFFETVTDAEKLHYTIYDNQYLIDKDPEYLKDLQSYKDTDSNFYDIYFLGKWGELSGVIYQNWDITPVPDVWDEIIYGLDFGFSTSYTALIKIYRCGEEYYLQEKIYERGLIVADLIEKMKEEKINKTDEIYADGARPESIEEISRAKYNIFAADKSTKTVVEQIDYMKAQTIHICEDSENIIKEQKSYIWKKDKDGNALNEPIKKFDHGMDAARYAIFSSTHKEIEKKYTFSFG
jgi:phage terminase large subunit